MRRLIAYDVSSDRRRYRAATVLLRRGVRLQKSVYECDEEDVDRLVEELAGIIDLNTDVIHVFSQCHGCRESRQEIGQSPPSLDDLWWIV